MGHAAPISLDRFRRRGAAAERAAGHAATEGHPLMGLGLGEFERKYGLMTSRELVSISEVVTTSGDLAVADRLAFMEAARRHVPVLVIEYDGWFVACIADRAMDPAEYARLIPTGAEPHPRLMSIVTDRGIVPALGPLA